MMSGMSGGEVCRDFQVDLQMVNIWKYKAQFMARGFVVDYEETTAPMGKYTSFMVLAAKLEWRLHQTDEEIVF